MRVGGAVTHNGPGDYVSAVVRARAGVLAEVELERFNLQQEVLGGKPERQKKDLDMKQEESRKRKWTEDVLEMK